jgi:drug/metabolite transporter (DMT)-like permease
VLWGVAVLGERLQRRALAGAVLASVGVVLVGL